MTADWEGIPVHPGGAHPYSLDVAEQQHEMHLAGDPGWLIALYDSWVLGAANSGLRRDAWQGQHVIGWTPIDHYPVPPEVGAWCRTHPTIAMSLFGQRSLAELDIESTYIPHALDLSEWRPTPSDVRSRIGIRDDQFMVMVNAANNGISPPRKAFVEMLSGFALFAREHPDVVLYLHTALKGANRVDLPFVAATLGLDPQRLKAVGQTPYAMGMFSTADMAQLYTAADVLLSTSMGEGFGIPVIEAMACGTPAIVTDFSAQPELVGETGWKVKYQPTYNHMMGSFLATPSIPDIHRALEAAYAEWHTDAAQVRSQTAIARVREEYDADRVYAERWRPLLAKLEAEAAPKPSRKGMSRGAQKRARKAA
ncbi:MAG: glycosyltransferase family 4 protein [Chloroflexi bacterium]|nr:glycosyltransferase family 4 protein [Chloroflexota bacterium]